MTDTVVIRRILVALDNSPGSLAAATAAAQLAAALGSELTGLFVEDVRLLEVGALPVAREFDLLTARTRRPGGADLERQLRVSAERARFALAGIADELGARWTFRVVRGAVGEEILRAAGGVDLVSLGRFGWSLDRRRRLGSTVQALLATPGAHLLLSSPAGPIVPPALAVFDGSAAGGEALRLTAAVARRSWDAPLTVVLLGDDQDDLRETALDRLGPLRRNTTFKTLRRGSVGRLAHAIALQDAGLTVVPVGGALGEELLHALVERLDRPILAVRGAATGGNAVAEG